MNSIAILGSIWPTTVEGWVNLVVFIVGFVAAVAALVPTVIKLAKKGAELVKNKNWSKIEKIAMAAMRAAEETGKKGAEKQQMVIDAVRSGCAEAGILVSDDDLKKLVSYIDETIAWFKSMKDSTPKKEAQKKGKKPSCRKFLVTAEEEASVGE